MDVVAFELAAHEQWAIRWKPVVLAASETRAPTSSCYWPTLILILRPPFSLFSPFTACTSLRLAGRNDGAFGGHCSLVVKQQKAKPKQNNKTASREREREGQKINSNVLHSVCVLSVEVSSDLRLQELGVRWIQSPANETILELLKPSYFVSKRLKSNKIVWR